MKMWILELQSLKSGLVDYIKVYAPEKVGSEIGWGFDDKQPDGIQRWRVLSCTEVEA